MLRAGLSSAAWGTARCRRSPQGREWLLHGIGNAHFVSTAPRLRRAASISSTCYVPATAITSSIPRRSITCVNARCPPRRSPLGRTSAALLHRPGRWTARLDRLSISVLKVNPDPVIVATEGAFSAASSRMASCPTPSSSAMTPGSSTSARMACARSMPSASFTARRLRG